MLIRTTLQVGKYLVFKDRFMLGEIELLNTPAAKRSEIIDGARRLGFARCLNAYRDHCKLWPKKKT